MSIDNKITDSWKSYQLTNKNNIVKTDTFNIEDLVYIGGLDISFSKKKENVACAYLTIYNFKEHKIIHEEYKVCEMKVPYVSGYLGFREIPEYVELLQRVKDKPFYPQLLLVDGCGILHHREFGSASHIGFEINLPSIGVSKTLLCHDGLSERYIKNEFNRKCYNKGDIVELKGRSGGVWGVALKSGNNVTNPIYVSIGHKISLETAIKIVIECSDFRIPEPIRNSDIKSKLYI